MIFNLFSVVLDMSITASVAAVVILGIKALLQRIGFSRGILMLLWLLIAFRLVCPCVPQSVLSAFNLIKNSGGADNGIIVTYNAPAGKAVYGDDSTALTYKNNQSLQKHRKISNAFKAESIISVIWLCGVAVMLASACVLYIRLKRQLRFSIKYGKNIYTSEHIAASFVLGIVKPRIYISSALLPEHAKNMIAHEKMHIKRLDHISKIAGWIILSFHWFNPFVWLMFRMFSADVEFACDEAVIKGGVNKKSYLNSLLAAAGNPARQGLHGVLCSFANQPKSRVKNLVKFKKQPLFMYVLSLIVCVIMCFSFGTNGTEAKDVSRDIATSEPEHKGSHKEISEESKSITLSSAEIIAEEEPQDSSKEEAVTKASYEEYSYKTNLVSDELYTGYELLQYDKINVKTIESSLAKKGIGFTDGNAELDKSYIKGSYTWADGEICSSNIKCDKNGNISVYFDLNSESLMQVSICDALTGQKVDEALVVANGENVYSFLGYDPNLTYNIFIKSATGNEWKIHGDYIIY